MRDMIPPDIQLMNQLIDNIQLSNTPNYPFVEYGYMLELGTWDENEGRSVRCVRWDRRTQTRDGGRHSDGNKDHPAIPRMVRDCEG